MPHPGVLGWDFLRQAKSPGFDKPDLLSLRLTHVAKTRRVVLSFTFLITLTWITVICLFCPDVLAAQDGASSVENGCTLRIHVDGLRNSTGVIGSVIFKSSDGWPEDPHKAFRRGPTPIPPGARQATVVWEHLLPGDYAVAAIHDENRNAKLDRNFIGIPKEGFGFANNPHVGLSAPPFSSALVHIACPVTETTIHLQYR
jgi:uncharacterized protein (DUF2141 family)